MSISVLEGEQFIFMADGKISIWKAHFVPLFCNHFINSRLKEAQYCIIVVSITNLLTSPMSLLNRRLMDEQA